MTNETKKPESAAVMESDPTQHILFRHIAALLTTQIAAKAFIDSIDIDDYSPEEKALAESLQNPLMHEKKNALLMEMVRQILLFVMPGPDIIVEQFGLSKMVNPNGDVAIALIMEIQPGKKVVKILPRKSAETMEAELKKFMDQIFGRLIRI